MRVECCDSARVWSLWLFCGASLVLLFENLLLCRFFVTSCFVRLETVTGDCSIDEHIDSENCRTNDGIWKAGIDISGHTFLLVYLALVIAEEVSTCSSLL